jgi:hypothetical protein
MDKEIQGMIKMTLVFRVLTNGFSSDVLKEAVDAFEMILMRYGYAETIVEVEELTDEYVKKEETNETPS